MAEIIGIPDEEQALSAVGGGDREIPDAEKDRIAQHIQDSARANAAWRDSLPFSQQLSLANVPIVNFPPEGIDAQAQSVPAEPAPAEPTSTEPAPAPAPAGV